jgi:hypothetical protein
MNLAVLAEQIADDLLPMIPALNAVRLTDLIHHACVIITEDEFMDPASLDLLCEFVRRRLTQ